MPDYTTTIATLLAGVVGGAALCFAALKQSKPPPSTSKFICQETPPNPTTPAKWLSFAVARMKKITPPRQSNFRVYAILTWEDTTHNTKGWISGTNSEQSFIGGSLCAERAAAVQLRELPSTVQVTAVYLTSDLLGTPITPGVLCREYLLSCISPDTPIWMTTADLSTTTSSTLRQLYPYPNMYERITRNNLKACGQACCAKTAAVLDQDHWRHDSDTNAAATWSRLIAAAGKASQGDAAMGGSLHPIMYGAAVEFNDGSIRVSCQKAGLEYGTTVDAVTSLLRDIDTKNNEGARPIRLVQVDQYENLIAPFAPARAQLYERGHEDLKVAVVDPTTGRKRSVTVASLVPDCPKMSEIWG